MKQQNYHCTITAKISIKEAFEKINRISAWWTKGFTGRSQKLGDTFTVRFGDTFVDFEITEVIPDEKIVWQVVNSNLHWVKDKKEWNNTKVVWELLSQNGTTQVSMTHVGLVPGIECYANCKAGWNFYVGESLLKLLTKNRGRPDKENKVIFGNHSSVIVPQQDRDRIRRFYCDVLGGKITKADPQRDFVCLGEDFYIGFLYADVPDVSEFLRTARSVWLEIKSDDAEEMGRKIIESGLIRKLDMPDPHLYFQAPGGQCMRLVGTDEDLSFYEGAGEGPNVAKVKEAVETGIKE